jgi:tetratricopeptide (TPR) repeat protein
MEMEHELAAALHHYNRHPSDETNIIWYGRRLAYLGRYDEAIDVYSRGLRIHPRSFRLLRHRGHRFITLRRFDAAAKDLSRAAELVQHLPDEIEPDGRPNALGVPRSTTQTNIWYHLGLARYLQGDDDRALEAWRICAVMAPNDDMRVAANYWRTLAARRLGRTDEVNAALRTVRAEMDIIENHDYHALLLAFGRGRADESLLEGRDPASISFATIGYGVGAWQRVEGNHAASERTWRRVIAGGNHASFGFIGAEVGLARSPR